MSLVDSSVSSRDPEAIRRMFGAIARAYDPANTVLSLGIHKRWKKQLVRESRARAGSRILDCATGTGDLAFAFERELGGQCEIVATDFCEEMLTVARQKLGAPRSSLRIEAADAMHLPYEDASFDVATISFGIRNTPDPVRVLAEMARVVKPGGRVMVLEFGKPKVALVRAAFGWYSKRVLPKLGGWISGQPEAYKYLERSSAEFPCGEKFLELARGAAPFSQTSCRAFQGGIAYLYGLVK